MRTSRGRSFAAGSGAAVILILGSGVMASRETIRELWTIHFDLRAEDGSLRKLREREPDGQSRQRAAIEWLEARRSVRAAPRLLEIAGQEHSRRKFQQLDGGLSIPQLALRALRSIPLGEDWYIARLRSGGEGERLTAIRRLAELGSRKSVPHLESIAREEGPPGYAAAAAMAQVLPSLTLDGIVQEEGGGMIGRFRLLNPAPSRSGSRATRWNIPSTISRKKGPAAGSGFHYSSGAAPGSRTSSCRRVPRPRSRSRCFGPGSPCARGSA